MTPINFSFLTPEQALDLVEKIPDQLEIQEQALNRFVSTTDRDLSSRIIHGKYSVIHFATMRGFASTVELLSKNKKLIDLTNDELDQTPLSLALTRGREKIRDILLKAGANPDSDDVDSSPIFIALSTNSRNLRAIIEAGADLEVLSESETVLNRAVLWASNKAIHLLLQAGANANALTKYRHTIFFDAVTTSKSIVELLLPVIEDVNMPNSRGTTPLQSAVMEGREEIAVLLMQNGAEI